MICRVGWRRSWSCSGAKRGDECARFTWPGWSIQVIESASSEAFFAASRHADKTKFRALLATGIGLYSDGDGKRSAAMIPIIGFDAVIALDAQLARVFAGGRSHLLRLGYICSLPGLVSLDATGVVQTTALDIEDGKIASINVVRNPDKLRRLECGRLH